MTTPDQILKCYFEKVGYFVNYGSSSILQQKKKKNDSVRNEGKNPCVLDYFQKIILCYSIFLYTRNMDGSV